MASSSISYNRHMQILDLLKKRGVVRVDELSDVLDVSVVTVRRDLDYLNARGFLVRTHGGATGPKDQPAGIPERDFTEKDVVNIAEKERIARKAAELISDDEIVFTNSGSTVALFLRALRGKRVRVITNNAAAIESRLDPLVELMILGGEYREQSRSFVGEFAINTLRDIYSSNTILGTNGLSLERGLTTTVYQECAVNQAMIENTHGKVIVLADNSKMDRIANFVSASLDQIDIVVTDDKCPERFANELESMGITAYLV
jgi:DeoR family transcriptional regulator, fructose operon transcriptional repressor